MVLIRVGDEALHGIAQTGWEGGHFLNKWRVVILLGSLSCHVSVVHENGEHTHLTAGSEKEAIALARKLYAMTEP